MGFVENQDMIPINTTTTTATVISVRELAVPTAKLIECNMAFSSLCRVVKLYPVCSGGLVCHRAHAQKTAHVFSLGVAVLEA
jgi:hypothetical protein